MSLFQHKNHPARAHKSHELYERLSNIGHDPHIDWVLILIFSSIIAAALVVAGFFAYVRAGNLLSQPPVVTAGRLATIDQALLNKILGIYEDRARERADLGRVYRGPSDPSF